MRAAPRTTHFPQERNRPHDLHGQRICTEPHPVPESEPPLPSQPGTAITPFQMERGAPGAIPQAQAHTRPFLPEERAVGRENPPSRSRPASRRTPHPAPCRYPASWADPDRSCPYSASRERPWAAQSPCKPRVAASQRSKAEDPAPEKTIRSGSGPPEGHPPHRRTTAGTNSHPG